MAQTSQTDSPDQWEDLPQLLRDQQELNTEYLDLTTELSAYLQIASRLRISGKEVDTLSELASDTAFEWERVGSEKEWVDEAIDRIFQITVKRLVSEAEDASNNSAKNP